MSPGYDPMDDDSDSCSIMSGSGRYAPSMASSATSYDWEMRSASPAPSVYSMTDSLVRAAFRHEFGRGINNYSEVYRLPADDEEFERLDKQHIMFMEVMGRYPPPMEEILADSPDEHKSVVDLGCGSGSWIMDVARDFPHCSAVAVDLVPMQVRNMPPNCRSEVDDINLGLQHFYGVYNVAHARLVCSGVRDYKGFIDHIARVLRPGGLIELTEFDFAAYNKHKVKIVLNHKDANRCWIGRWMILAHEAVEQMGGEPDAANHLRRWVGENDAFEDIVYRQFWFQTSPFRKGDDQETIRQNAIGAVMRDDILAFLKSGRPLLLSSGMDEAVVNEVEANACRELLEARTPSYILVEKVYARKKLTT
ncbi:S-adenosyl-L-methionine-dependent methyltransferase [Obba rivulosa]|uniref:S-adenosyl-L-methionine-dependent methyltransferase n=1 Tax=Obba rivulosa TaxID=1052685 RepID=A0A8E2APY0_9APHY|nr:S-adenosyl-L-methionine-dependent methyltransferase [Obba rivulosa]